MEWLFLSALAVYGAIVAWMFVIPARAPAPAPQPADDHSPLPTQP
jgi:hypothetical protein